MRHLIVVVRLRQQLWRWRMSWRISPYSTSGSNCVEAYGPWRTSTYSGETAYCVETSSSAATVRVRDTKDRERGHITVSDSTWSAFLAGVAG